MAEIKKSDCVTLGSFPNAPARSWSQVLTEQDRDVYRKVNATLKRIADIAAAAYKGKLLAYTTSGFHDASGVRDARPKDLWCSLVNEGSEAFIGMPQIFMIASGRGVEIGFAAAIHPSDFSSKEVKSKLKRAIPTLFDLFPEANSPLISSLSSKLGIDEKWYFQKKARLTPNKRDYKTLEELITTLKTAGGRKWGAASISRYIGLEELDSEGINLEALYLEAVEIFYPLMAEIKNRYFLGADLIGLDQLLLEANSVSSAAEIGSFDPQDTTQGRRMVLASIAVRQGQGGFRIKLLEAYNGRCAITGSTLVQILEAAHIVPYDGVETNHVTNGLLLRSDIHTLFDLGLIKISSDYKILISARISDPAYLKYAGQKLMLPNVPAFNPSVKALEWHNLNT